MLEDDLRAFFDPQHFAQVVVLAGVAVNGIFEDAYAAGDVGGMGMASARPSLTLPTASVPPRVIDWFRYFQEPFDPMDLRIDINGVEYLVVAHEPDGAGVSVLLLEKVT